MKMTMIKKNIKLTLHETTTTLKSAECREITAKGEPAYLVVLHTDKGDFSGFKQVWDKQKIDIEYLNEGAVLKITYVKKLYEKNGRMYNNFKFVTIVSNPVAKVAAPVENNTELSAEALVSGLEEQPVEKPVFPKADEHGIGVFSNCDNMKISEAELEKLVDDIDI